jgi:diadenosine tetraphosphatase ApaH/serine/threonine PP2A family protein phosphatase
MRRAIFADIHANLEAFEAVQQDINSIGVDQKVFLGDVGGYGPSPVECIELLISFLSDRDIAVLGNHDHALLTGDTEGFNRHADMAIMWQESIIRGAGARGAKCLEFLRSLKRGVFEGNDIYVHGSSYEPIKQYIMRTEVVTNMILSGMRNMGAADLKLRPAIPYQTALAALKNREREFAAHSHETGVYFEGCESLIPKGCYVDDILWPVALRKNGKDFYERNFANINLKEKCSDIITLPKDKPAVIVVGSVGQPRDRDPRACYVISDDESGVVEFRRVPYDIDATCKKIDATGKLSGRLSERLRLGE